MKDCDYCGICDDCVNSREMDYQDFLKNDSTKKCECGNLIEGKNNMCDFCWEVQSWSN